MNYIIMDLEWNQPISHQNRTYREVGDRLIFEMIQIGAVKMNEALEILDSLSVPICPTCYVKIHPRIRRMTGLGPEILDQAPAFREAMDRFLAWCGEDYVLLTWGCDDISVLQQNLDFFDYHPELPPICDIQHLFSDAHKLQNRMGLKPAMDMLGLEPQEDMQFHNAVNDAYYTALVFQKTPDPADALKYPQTPRQLIHPAHETSHGKVKGEYFDSIAQALESEAAASPKCPVCGRRVSLEQGGYVAQAPDKYIGLAKCNSHGMLLVRIRFRVSQSGKRWMGTSCVKATRQNIAYIHTKQLQTQQRRAAGLLPDPELALLNADRSSVPFED